MWSGVLIDMYLYDLPHLMLAISASGELFASLQFFLGRR